MRLPGAVDSPSPWPDPDDHLVEPETGWEMWRGELIKVSPALEEHADTHVRLDRVVDMHTADDYVASTDLLTRRSVDSDFATDTSVRKRGKNPATGSRYLEELSFEVFSSQSRSYARRRARDIIRSGVRRLFGLFVESDPAADGGSGDTGNGGSEVGTGAGGFMVRVEEWSASEDAWVPFKPGESIHDPCLLRPLAVKALIDATAADDACARSLIARRNAVIEELERKIRREGKDDGYKAGKDDGYEAGKDDGYEAGKDAGYLAGVRALACQVLGQRFGQLPAWASRRITAADVEQIQRWVVQTSTAASLNELLDEP